MLLSKNGKIKKCYYFDRVSIHVPGFIPPVMTFINT